MTYSIILFDMDGVLLKPMGYHRSLQTSVKRIGHALGAPNTELSDDQIARFEALGVTNEWDSLAICTALILTHLWQIDNNIRLTNLSPHPEPITDDASDFNDFLMTFNNFSELPAQSAYNYFVNKYQGLELSQKTYIQDLLNNCRNIYTSPTLPSHQETVLGSKAFQENYNLEAKQNIDSFLKKYDQPILSDEQLLALRAWLAKPGNHAGILTNRPNQTPSNYLSAPEAEFGAELVGLHDLPLLGSGMLAWFATTQCKLADHTFLKPNPVHSLALLLMCSNHTVEGSLKAAYHLWNGKENRSNWKHLDGSTVIIFEDSAKGLASGVAAQNLLKNIGVNIHVKLFGVTEHPVKRAALEMLADQIIPHINAVKWETLNN